MENVCVRISFVSFFTIRYSRAVELYLFCTSQQSYAQRWKPTVSPTYEDAQQGSKTEGRGLRMCHASSLPEYGFIATNCNSRASTADLHPPFVHLRDGAGECKLRGWRRPTDGRRAVEQNMR